MRIAVCDDEAAELQWIRQLLLKWAKEQQEFLETVCFSSGEVFWFSWEEDKNYDLLILDIEMGAINGMELAKKIRKEENEIPILFVTGYEEYMAQGYEVSAIHYLVKPLSEERLFAVLKRLKEGQKQKEKILFLGEEGMISFPVSKIWYMEACGHQCVMATEGKKQMLRESISAVEKKLKEKRGGFIRCHRSYLVNLGYVSAVLHKEIVLDNGERIPLSRRLEKEVYQAFIQNYR